MRQSCLAAIAIVGASAIGGCAQATLPSIAPTPVPVETAAVEHKPVGPAAAEASLIVAGSPTEVYALVARGALNCWFGGEGPLKRTHLFHADAAPPSKGGAAAIVLQERDSTLPDQRGPRALRVSFTSAAGGVQVETVVSKIAAPMADLMVRDVEIWARGGSGCQARTVAMPKEPAAVPSSGKTGKAAKAPR